jgi:GDP-D-mannose dehydratase
VWPEFFLPKDIVTMSHVLITKKFVTRQIANTAAGAKLNLSTELKLSNLDAKRD